MPSREEKVPDLTLPNVSSKFSTARSAVGRTAETTATFRPMATESNENLQAILAYFAVATRLASSAARPGVASSRSRRVSGNRGVA